MLDPWRGRCGLNTKEHIATSAHGGMSARGSFATTPTGEISGIDRARVLFEQPASLPFSRYLHPLISSPLGTSSLQGASFVSCAYANFFVRPASCLFSFCAGIIRRVVCGWRSARRRPRLPCLAEGQVLYLAASTTKCFLDPGDSLTWSPLDP